MTSWYPQDQCWNTVWFLRRGSICDFLVFFNTIIPKIRQESLQLQQQKECDTIGYAGRLENPSRPWVFVQGNSVFQQAHTVVRKHAGWAPACVFEIYGQAAPLFSSKSMPISSILDCYHDFIYHWKLMAR